MGANWRYSSTAEIWEEIRIAAPVFSGITHDRLKQSPGIFWPCYDESHTGTPRLYEDGFGFRDRRARLGTNNHCNIQLIDLMNEPMLRF